MNGFRWVLLVAAPFLICWAFVSTLVRDIGRAFIYAWLEVRHEVAAFRRLWREYGNG